MMQHLIISFLFILGVISTSGEQPSTPESKTCDDTPKTNTGKLKKKLFCGYDPSIRPVPHHSNQTFVKMAAFPVNIGWMMEERNAMWMSFWLIMQWKDDLLTWNSSQYDGLEEFHTDGNMVWVPEIFVSDPPQSQISRQMSCGVRSNGYVDCSKNMGVTARCSIDLTYFPNDRHHCKVVFRPRTYKNNALDLNFMNVEGTNPFKFYRSHGIWNMVSLNANRNVTKLIGDIYTIDIEYTFVLERRSSAYYNATPLAVMMMMVLCVFWLESQCSARILLPGLTILCHMIAMRWLMEVVNSNICTVCLRHSDDDDGALRVLAGVAVFRSHPTARADHPVSHDRHAVAHGVMMMMVLCVFWLESQCSARILLPGLTILCHMIAMRWLMEVVNSNFENLPVIVIVLRNSLLLNGLALVWSVASRALCSCSFAPYWLYTITTTINNNQVIKLFLPHDIFIKSGTSGDEDESSLVVHRDCTEQQWRILLILCDRIFFSIYLLLYMYFFMTLTP